MLKLFETYLPNFRYKKDKVIFILKKPVKLDIIKKTVWINESEINAVLLTENTVEYRRGNIQYKILPEENSNGLKVHIYAPVKFRKSDISNVIKHIEAQLLNILCDDSDSEDEKSECESVSDEIDKTSRNFFTVSYNPDTDW